LWLIFKEDMLVKMDLFMQHVSAILRAPRVLPWCEAAPSYSSHDLQWSSDQHVWDSMPTSCGCRDWQPLPSHLTGAAPGHSPCIRRERCCQLKLQGPSSIKSVRATSSCADCFWSWADGNVICYFWELVIFPDKVLGCPWTCFSCLLFRTMFGTLLVSLIKWDRGSLWESPLALKNANHLAKTFCQWNITHLFSPVQLLRSLFSAFSITGRN
jgi:hypothetical protein